MKHESKASIMVISDKRMTAIQGTRHAIPDPVTGIGNPIARTEDQQVINRFIGSKDKDPFRDQVRREDDVFIVGRENKRKGKRKRHLRAKRNATMTPFDSLPIRLNSVSQIDVVARIVFPICFLIINYFYWITYLGDE